MNATTETTRVETYRLTAMNGRHIRMATQVTFPNGQVVKFTERMPRGQAIQQAMNILAAE